MTLQSLRVENVRCVAEGELEFEPGSNLISGPNASGKTTLLESIYVLGRGRSFRSSRLDTLIRAGQAQFRLVGRLRLGQRQSTVGFEADRDGSRARLDGASISSLAELALALPVQAIDPEVHRLIEGGPLERRRFLDWGVFHVEPNFMEHWRRFQRALRQRNAALKAHASPAEIRAWDPELIASGIAVTRHRADYLSDLAPSIEAMGQRLLHASIKLDLRAGWPAEKSLEEAVDGTWLRDVERQQTHVGPHRAELVVRFGDAVARDRVSRGQQKLLAAAMLLGQLKHDAERGSATAALLVDDPAAELDKTSLERLIREVRELPVQLFVTALDPHDALLQGLQPARRFHVEHGIVTALL